MTTKGKIFLTILVLLCAGFGVWRWTSAMADEERAAAERARNAAAQAQAASGASADARSAAQAAAEAGPDPAQMTAAMTEVPVLAPPGTYLAKDGTIDIELSEYAGYAGLIAANGGLEPNEGSLFFQRGGFKVRLTLSEEESWSALNSGRLAASATTVDVLAVYGRQFQVVVPAQIGFSRGADGIVVESGLKRINALKGRVLAASQFTEADFFLRYLAQEAGLLVHTLSSFAEKPDPERLNLVYCTDAFAAGDVFAAELASGRKRLAGCVTWEPKTSEVVEGSGGKAHALVTNKNLLIVADILVVNKGFARDNAALVDVLVQGLLEGNRRVRENAEAELGVIAKAFGWELADAREELAKVHFSNLPESQAFFSGSIDSAGSYGGIYQAAVLAYGKEYIPDPVDAERFFAPAALEAAARSGSFAAEKISIAPIKTGDRTVLEGDPLLSRDIHFYFLANEDRLDPKYETDNATNMGKIQELLRVSPGSSVLLRGHVDNAKVEELKRGGEAQFRTHSLRAVELSKKRANEVKRQLVEKDGAVASRIDTVGRGWEEPISPEPAKNRRVEVQWYTLE